MLQWRDAEHADRRALQRFKCTEHDLRMEMTALGRSPVHPRMYAWEVQEHLRELRVPLKKSWAVRLGFDASELLGGVAVIQEIDAGRDYDLAACAIACHARVESRKAADSMMEDVFACIVQRSVDAGATASVRVSGQIHRDNHASKWMCTRANMSFRGIDDCGYEIWARDLPLPELGR